MFFIFIFSGEEEEEEEDELRSKLNLDEANFLGITAEALPA